MFTYFTDRDGKYQLCALAERVDPLARTTKFMTEEAHHMFVGESGIPASHPADRAENE
jgi:benzoyl-CoA 2,3-dioxygenase component B